MIRTPHRARRAAHRNRGATPGAAPIATSGGTRRRTLSRRSLAAAVATLAALATLLLGPGAALAAWDGGNFAADVSEAAPGETVTFTVVATYAPDDPPFGGATGVTFSGTIPAAYTGVSWSCSATNATCAEASGSGNAIDLTANVGTTGQAATVTLVITATVAADAPAGPVSTDICLAYSYVGDLYVNGTRALPLLQDGCLSATVTIAEEPTPTPEPTETATAEPTPATPIASQTVTPGQPEPTQPAAPITQLPSTGAGDSGANSGLLATLGVIAVFAIGALGLAGLRLRRRG